jgi:hypothetical protein
LEFMRSGDVKRFKNKIIILYCLFYSIDHYITEHPVPKFVQEKLRSIREQQPTSSKHDSTTKHTPASTRTQEKSAQGPSLTQGQTTQGQTIKGQIIKGQALQGQATKAGFIIVSGGGELETKICVF